MNEFLGNISLKVVGMLCTVALFAAAYFFFVKPALDTTSDAIDSVASPIKEAQQQAAKAQQQAQQQAQGKGNSSPAQINLNKLQACVQKAGQDVNALQRCTVKFAP